MGGIVLGDNQYGKAETHVVRLSRSGPQDNIKDLTVSVALAGDFAATHLTGDNSRVLTTDTQKNTVFAFAREGIGEIEDFGLRLARHFVGESDPVERARVTIEEHPWDRIDGHAFVRYTTLPETKDRILATAVTARWRYGGTEDDWARSFGEARRLLLEAFARKHSLSLQQTLYAMGEAVLKAMPEIVEIRMSMPNKHHFVVDLSPFGLTNENEVFYAADRPYGLIEGTVVRDDAPEAGLAWG
ncbi:MAG: urate oxidase [Chloroflexi bacterium]|nr:MAG: urate oxidase [Chloroflexota bacterium]